MPVASFSGLASGIDTASLVSQLVSLERAPIKRLETKQANLLSMSRRFSEISKRVDALSSASEALVGATKLLGATASSTDESKVRVSATGDATLGGFSVEVRSLARAERTYSDGIAARDAAGLFGSGTLTLGIGTASTDVTVEATGTQQSRVQDVGPVGGGQYDHVLVGLKAIHLDQQLVEGLFAFVVAAAQAGAALATNGVDLVDEDDTG